MNCNTSIKVEKKQIDDLVKPPMLGVKGIKHTTYCSKSTYLADGEFLRKTGAKTLMECRVKIETPAEYLISLQEKDGSQHLCMERIG